MQEAGRRADLLWGAVFGALVVVLLWSRLVGLDQSFWNDEVVTAMRYVGEGPGAIFFGDYAPNNHMLFSLLSWVTVGLLGESEAAYRIWSVVPALGATLWLVWWSWRRFGRLVAATTLLLMTVSPLVLVLSREARGYGLAILAAVGLVIQADAALTEPGGRAVWLFAGFGLLGVLTLPVFVLPYLLAGIPLLIDARLRRKAAAAIALSGLISLVWFSPVLAEIIEHSAQQFGRLIPWHGVVTFSMSQLVFPVYRLLLSNTPNVLLTFPRDPLPLTLLWHALSWSLVVLGARNLWLAKRPRLVAVLSLPPIGTYVILAAGGIWAADRHLSYLTVFLFMLVALGVGRLVDLLRQDPRQVSLAFLAGFAVWLVVSFYSIANEVVSTPHEATKEVSEAVEMIDASRVITNSERPAGLRYYIDKKLEILDGDELERLFCGTEAGYVFIHHPFKAEDLDTSCLEERSAQHVRFDQRGRGGWMDVWHVET